MMQVSAAVRLMPSPPARVDSRNTNMSGSVLKASMFACGSPAHGPDHAPRMETRSASGGRPRTSQQRGNMSARSSRQVKKRPAPHRGNGIHMTRVIYKEPAVLCMAHTSITQREQPRVLCWKIQGQRGRVTGNIASICTSLTTLQQSNNLHIQLSFMNFYDRVLSRDYVN